MTIEDPTAARADFSWDVLRADDLLALGFRFYNLVPDCARPWASLVRVRPDQPALVVVELAPQHISEGAAAEQDPGPTPVPVPVRHRLAGPSRLAFRVPDRVPSVPFTLEALLDWETWTALLLPVMTPPEPGGQAPTIRRPTATETSIELPYRLMLNPDRSSGWDHCDQAQDLAGYAELWHSRLTSTGTTGPTVRAVWSPDWPEPTPDWPQPSGSGADLQAMLPDHRRQIVGLTSDYTGLAGPGGARLDPVAVPVDQLMVSALGGWLRVHGSFSDPAPQQYDLVDWEHVATEGRDHHTKQVNPGTLYPFGLRAHLVTVTERKVSDLHHRPVAALLQRQFIILQQPFRDYTADGIPTRYQWQGREMPLTTVRCTTTTTPNLMPDPSPLPGLPDRSGGVSRKVLVPDGTPDGTPVPFHIIATDVSGGTVEFNVGMLWISDLDRPFLSIPQVQAELAAAYAKKPPDDIGEPLCHADLAGQRVTFADDPDLTGTGATSLHTEVLRHEAVWVAPDAATGPPPDQAGSVPPDMFLPRLREAVVRVPALQQLAGPAAPSMTIRLAHAHLDATAPNKVGLFAEIVDPPLPVTLPQKLTGGLINPDLKVTGLSADLGPVAGRLSNLAEGRFDPDDPEDFFRAVAGTKLFGAVGLGELIDQGFNLRQMPKIVTRVEPASGPPSRVVTTLSYSPSVRTRPALGFHPDTGCTMVIDTVLDQRLDDGPPTATTHARLTNFTFSLPPDPTAVIKVHFQALSFYAEAGKKPDFSVDLMPSTPSRPSVEFVGVLGFLNKLREYIPSDGFSDPPAIEVTESGLRTGYTLGLPPLAIGVFQLTDVRLGAELQLPFTAAPPRLRFSFCEREHPCLLTVSMLGGGAYLALAVGLNGIELIEAAIDFGGSFSLELGVASGSVSALAGIYFRYDITKQHTELAGFLRIHGSVEVLGLVSVSVQFDMSLGYILKQSSRHGNGQGDQQKGVVIHGEATLTVKVDLTLFSKSVSLSVQRSYGSGPGDPDFAALLPAQSDWDSYAGAFGVDTHAGDIKVPGAYDATGWTPEAVWRPRDGRWYIQPAAGGLPFVYHFGQAGDFPVPADYDGDGRTDLAVWRPSEGCWYVRPSSGGPTWRRRIPEIPDRNDAKELALLATSMLDLSVRMRDAPDWRDHGVIPLLEGVAIYQRLIKNPATYQRQLEEYLAGQLVDHICLWLAWNGLHQEARILAEEAVQRCRQLAATPDDPMVARALENLGHVLSVLPDWLGEAADRLLEGVVMWKRLIDNPTTYQPKLAHDLAFLLVNYGCSILVRAGRREEAKAYAEYARDLFKRLTEQDPNLQPQLQGAERLVAELS